MEKPEASVVAALGQAHAELLADLRDLERLLGSRQGGGAARLYEQLGMVQICITEHFRLEEKNGYMETVRKRAPRLERTVQQLAEEHLLLARLLGSLREQARLAPSLSDDLVDRVLWWIRQVEQHEIRENDLVQEAFNLDIGAGD